MYFIPCTQSRTGARHPGISCSSSIWRSRGAAGAVALRLMIWNGYGMERYRPPRRTGVSASTRMGAHGPGSSLPAPRKRIHRAFTRMAHPGISPVRPDEADSQPSFLGSPWPDLPRRASDRRSDPHHPDPATHNQNGTWSGSC